MRKDNLKICEATGKLRFPTEKKSKVALALAKAKGRKELRSYKCPFCGDWHMTSKANRYEHLRTTEKSRGSLRNAGTEQSSSEGGN